MSLINSLYFLVYFPIVLIVFFLLKKPIFKTIWLLASSCFFYMVFIPKFILILFGIIIIDYSCGLLLAKTENQQKRLLLLSVSIASNIGILFYFKYFKFLIENFNRLLSHFSNGSAPFDAITIIIPLGLSFHTFQALSYIFEVYKKRQSAEKNFFVYALYVMYFPQLVAGPIERPQAMLHQYHHYLPFNEKNVIAGIRLMLWGFFKKLVIADRLAVFVNAVFSQYGSLHGFEIFISAAAFYFQIYCDFSGYSDIAIGASRCFGIKLMKNFDRPYTATSIKDFWQRWHLSLTSWFRTYIYIPLGGNKKGKLLQYIFIIIVFILSGFWHGANWTFIVWGLIFAVLYIVEDLLNFQQWKFFPTSLRIVYSFIIVSITWIFFRAENIQTAMAMTKKCFSIEANYFSVRGDYFFTTYSLVVSIAAILFMLFIESRFTYENTQFSSVQYYDSIISGLILAAIICFGVFGAQSFIYFQF